MRKKFLILIAALVVFAICTPLTACSQTRILTDFPTGSGVEKVFISKAMLNMGLPRKEFFNYKNMFGEVQCMEVYNCENSSLVDPVKSKIDGMLKKYHAEIMLESEEENESSRIYTLFEEKREKTLGLAIINFEGDDINIVILHGDVLFP